MSKSDKSQTITIYIFMDDSGKLTEKEKVSVYAGISFTSSYEKDKFVRQYKSILNSIKCNYCNDEKDTCNKESCPEVKSFNISSSHKRQLINLCKQFCTYAVVINNSKVYPSILKSKASKGRYTDYAQKIIIKEVVLYYIRNGIIDPNKDLNLIINIDQQSTKSNGYYSLEESIKEELAHGIYNFNYMTKHHPIIFGELSVSVQYLDSKKVYSIQASDIIAGKTRTTVLHTKDYKELSQKLNSFLKIKKFLP